MKLISDFDDVLFNNTKQFKVHLFDCLEKAGVPRATSENEYKNVRSTGIPFSLKRFLALLAVKNNVNIETMKSTYEEIMQPCRSFLNVGVLRVIENLGKDNCYMITNGEAQYQQDKIDRSGVTPLFKEIYIVPDSKRNELEKICASNKDEKFVFVEDREKFVADLDMSKLPNLKIVIFDENGLEKLKAELGVN